MTTRISRTAFLTLLLIAIMMGGNHVAARFAFNDSVSVITAVIFRSGVTALIITLLLVQQKVRIRFSARHKQVMPVIGVLVAIQSFCLYSAVARLPIALALLAFNTYPLCSAFWARVLYKHRAEPFVLKAMPVMLLGLALALDVFGAASGLGAAAHWQQIGAGVGYAIAATSTKQAPWYVVPADSKPHRDLFIANLLVQTLARLDLPLPKPTFSIDKVKLD